MKSFVSYKRTLKRDGSIKIQSWTHYILVGQEFHLRIHGIKHHELINKFCCFCGEYSL